MFLSRTQCGGSDVSFFMVMAQFYADCSDSQECSISNCTTTRFCTSFPSADFHSILTSPRRTERTAGCAALPQGLSWQTNVEMRHCVYFLFLDHRRFLAERETDAVWDIRKDH